MVIKRNRSWELPQSAVTCEATYLARRSLLKAMGFGGGALMAGAALARTGAAAAATMDDPSAVLYPAKHNDAYTAGDGRTLTDFDKATRYNNFYEFGTDKSIWRDAQENLKVRPWQVEIAGEVDKPFTLDIDDLLKKMPLEERIYRHRCVEAWSMCVPWTGFQLSHLVELAKPLSSAKFVKMTTFNDPEMGPGLRQFWYPWPYVEGLTMAEANNELAFMVTGLYGKPLPAQNGAPLRLATPWKYGFKSIKSIVKFEFVSKQPVNFWQELQAQEYGFWANVNPDVPHPRWSQAQERDLQTGDSIPTQIYNGYGETVASLYSGLNLPDTVLFR